MLTKRFCVYSFMYECWHAYLLQHVPQTFFMISMMAFIFDARRSPYIHSHMHFGMHSLCIARQTFSILACICCAADIAWYINSRLDLCTHILCTSYFIHVLTCALLVNIALPTIVMSILSRMSNDSSTAYIRRYMDCGIHMLFIILQAFVNIDYDMHVLLQPYCIYSLMYGRWHAYISQCMLRIFVMISILACISGANRGVYSFAY